MNTAWLYEFTPFSMHHLVLTLLCAAVAWLVIRYARTVRGTHAELHVRIVWAFMTLGGEVGSTIIWNLPERYTRENSWPIHLCDYAAWLAAFAMLSPLRWPKTLLFFWGIGLSTQGLLTPAISFGALWAEYWVYWVQHMGVVGGAVYLAVVNGYRPTLKDLAFATGATIALAGFMVWLNIAAGTNYMYLGNSLPDKPTILDALGPWPGRLIWISLLGMLGFVLTYLGSRSIHAVRSCNTKSPHGSRPSN